MNDNHWINVMNPYCSAGTLTIDDLYRAMESIKKKPIPARFEAGRDMYEFMQRALSPAEAIPQVLTGIEFILRDDLPAEHGHLYDTENWIIDTFILQDGEEGLKVMVFHHPRPGTEEFWSRHDFQRAPQAQTEQRPSVCRPVENHAARAAHHRNDGSSPLKLWLDAAGLGSEDGGEPGEDQAG